MLPALRARKFPDNIRATIGDQQPSHVYKQLQRLATIPATDGHPETMLDLVREVLLTKLPCQTVAAITNTSTMDLNDFLKTVDAIHLAHKSTEPTQPPVAAGPSQPQQQTDTETDSDLEDPAAPIHHYRNSRWKNKPKYKPKAKHPEGIFFYHWRFGSKSRKCENYCHMSK